MKVNGWLLDWEDARKWANDQAVLLVAACYLIVQLLSHRDGKCLLASVWAAEYWCIEDHGGKEAISDQGLGRKRIDPGTRQQVSLIQTFLVVASKNEKPQSKRSALSTAFTWWEIWRNKSQNRPEDKDDHCALTFSVKMTLALVFKSSIFIESNSSWRSCCVTLLSLINFFENQIFTTTTSSFRTRAECWESGQQLRV